MTQPTRSSDKPLRQPTPDTWPQKVRSVETEELGNFGIDPSDKLYWNGKPVKTEKRFKLSRAQAIVTTVVALLAASASVGVFVIELLRYLDPS